MQQSLRFCLDYLTALTISNDSIRIYDLPRSRRDYMKSLTLHEKPLRRYPGVLFAFAHLLVSYLAIPQEGAFNHRSQMKDGYDKEWIMDKLPEDIPQDNAERACVEVHHYYMK